MTVPPVRGPARVVIDCDPGRDDALAILAAIGTPELQVDFITTVAGNVPLDRATANALGVLAVAGVDDVPVYRGASRPLERSLPAVSSLHGDLAGDDPPLPEARQAVSGRAHEALAAWSSERDDQPKRLIAIGPLTNLGHLLRDDGKALSGVDEIFVMGGTVGQIETRVSPTAEFNFYTDPEAVDLVLRCSVPVFLFDYDSTTSCQIDVAAIERIAGAIGPPVGGFVGGWLRHQWEHANRIYGRQGIAVHDLYAVAGAAGVEPDRWEWFDLDVDMTDSGRGTLRSRVAPEGQGVAVARGLDPERMVEFLVDSVRGLTAHRVR